MQMEEVDDEGSGAEILRIEITKNAVVDSCLDKVVLRLAELLNGAKTVDANEEGQVVAMVKIKFDVPLPRRRD